MAWLVKLSAKEPSFGPVSENEVRKLISDGNVRVQVRPASGGRWYLASNTLEFMDMFVVANLPQRTTPTDPLLAPPLASPNGEQASSPEAPLYHDESVSICRTYLRTKDMTYYFDASTHMAVEVDPITIQLVRFAVFGVILLTVSVIYGYYSPAILGWILGVPCGIFALLNYRNPSLILYQGTPHPIRRVVLSVKETKSFDQIIKVVRSMVQPSSSQVKTNKNGVLLHGAVSFIGSIVSIFMVISTAKSCERSVEAQRRASVDERNAEAQKREIDHQKAIDADERALAASRENREAKRTALRVSLRAKTTAVLAQEVNKLLAANARTEFCQTYDYVEILQERPNDSGAVATLASLKKREAVEMSVDRQTPEKSQYCLCRDGGIQSVYKGGKMSGSCCYGKGGKDSDLPAPSDKADCRSYYALYSSYR